MEKDIIIMPSGIKFISENNLLNDALKQNINLEYSCKTGDCGSCSAEIVSGSIENEDGEVVNEGSILTCQSKAVSDSVLKANYYPELSEIKIQTMPCKVSSLEYVSDDVAVLRFRFPPKNKFDYLPGQYIDLSYKGIKRSYSIANAKQANSELELHMRKVPEGKMSKLMFQETKINQLMSLEGPKGTFFVRHNDKKLIFIATGTGIAPVKAMVEQLVNDHDKREIFIYWGNRYQKDIYSENLSNLALQYSNVHFTNVLSRDTEWSERTGYVQDAVIQDFETFNDVQVYACGSIDMIQSAKSKLVSNGLLAEDFLSDAFTAAK